jgi:hypothetical protein
MFTWSRSWRRGSWHSRGNWRSFWDLGHRWSWRCHLRSGSIRASYVDTTPACPDIKQSFQNGLDRNSLNWLHHPPSLMSGENVDGLLIDNIRNDQIGKDIISSNLFVGWTFLTVLTQLNIADLGRGTKIRRGCILQQPHKCLLIF